MDLINITDKDEGRERWHQFLRNEDCEDKTALPKIEEIFNTTPVHTGSNLVKTGKF